MAQVNWRSINIDALDPESSSNFDLSTLTPAVQPVSSQDVQALSGQIRQLWRGGDAEGALRGALENAPYGADAQSKDSYMQTVTEVLQQVRTADMAPILQRIYTSDGGSELCDVLMKYLYKGMASGASTSNPSKNVTPQATGFSQVQPRNTAEGQGGNMGVFLTWHEKVIEVAGPGSIVRVMSDRRTV
ncbi:Arp2/3 complex 16 kDa subunit ARPC5 [Aureobasidium subglaciale]|uniref:Actin-related protein 2/3 complex subunit 5 n=1 Tax=Aureobasidium subglaciale (strain EXF-2481) TaxID=1043005 RepID=A0A074YCB1_AURSE|nr:uncharacterized protein AUEXF2481DRAFT_6697 [Aureobasidium subglaciale EXF-2481]KAI5212723.1 Arp2/3 complex 16 kDa subunit ARPC5 [Aureobasidium subglaciale]KAI5232596.1 Arp2/3 complex 16 kDa subunit ARPC5 [Aureobasidium subglaciale]KAI5234741.1 Arp2/3 complex 16 kDa subunit ARPC5 [Aureobasidium subglaciale]KAI5239658.1 Arp2/3 complex 16 kDa subunit ARPC5 [Aureobasidium subglaciale]KAI5248402.1 Arp2/3 complex 16 kDa subunit ARPC5 [Aureobasidium subglaciale]